MQKPLTIFAILTILLFTNSAIYAGGGTAGGLDSDFTKLHLTLLDDNITYEDDLTALEPGLYELIVANKTAEKATFEIQDLKTEKVLGKIKIRPNRTKKARVKLTNNGFKFRKAEETWHEFSIE